MKLALLFCLLSLGLGSTSCYDMMYTGVNAAYLRSSDDTNSGTEAQDDQPAPQPDTVYLKDGSIIHGQVIEEVPGASLKIQTASGNVYTYAMAKIAKITHGSVDGGDTPATDPGASSSKGGAVSGDGPQAPDQ